jgi:hypothetical protein
MVTVRTDLMVEYGRKTLQNPGRKERRLFTGLVQPQDFEP